MELVSPILSGREGIDNVQVVVGLLSKVDVSVNSSAGFHLHVGSANFSLEDLKKISFQFLKYEMAFDSIFPPSRQGLNNQYCKSHLLQFRNYSNETIKEKIKSCFTLNYLKKFMNPQGDRYFKLNLQRTSHQSPTIEFRQHNGTSNYIKIQAWILLILHFVNNTVNSEAFPDNFQNDRDAEYQLKRMFMWVVKQPMLEAYYTQRARKYGVWDPYLCECGRSFPFPSRLYQHQNDMGHSDPVCCNDCKN
eukprot:TRINITY_DN2781_c0_g1_i1.p1 TRINITY_DN2781_c0_g1~~TRINITY_DN2781_c0_g1_i1.p1  ORF type:complete len:248 (-),score=46.51 TRINITY_DN2781_c0_g1_i1:33-776(-)